MDDCPRIERIFYIALAALIFPLVFDKVRMGALHGKKITITQKRVDFTTDYDYLKTKAADPGSTLNVRLCYLQYQTWKTLQNFERREAGMSSDENLGTEEEITALSSLVAQLSQDGIPPETYLNRIMDYKEKSGRPIPPPRNFYGNASDERQ